MFAFWMSLLALTAQAAGPDLVCDEFEFTFELSKTREIERLVVNRPGTITATRSKEFLSTERRMRTLKDGQTVVGVVTYLAPKRMHQTETTLFEVRDVEIKKEALEVHTSPSNILVLLPAVKDLSQLHFLNIHTPSAEAKRLGEEDRIVWGRFSQSVPSEVECKVNNPDLYSIAVP